MMTYATSSPAATTGGGQGNNHIPVSLYPLPLFTLSSYHFPTLSSAAFICTLKPRENDGNIY